MAQRQTAFEPPSEVCRAIADRGAALVALSGGVDSSLVASLAQEALGPRALAVTVASSAVPPREVARAREVAKTLGIRHMVTETEPLVRADYRENGPTRCYACRAVETEALLRVGRAEGSEQYLDGIHIDDLGEVRPGIRAMNEAGFLHPLLEAGWGKSEVRRLARARGLPNWDLPSDACLASRVAQGLPITSELLARVAAAETVLLDRGFRRVRVRVQAGRTSIEVDPLEVARLREPATASEVRGALARLGFSEVSIDPLGYRGGLSAPSDAR